MAAQKNLGRSVPSCSYIICELSVVHALTLQIRERTRQTKVRELQKALAVEQQVAGLHTTELVNTCTLHTNLRQLLAGDGDTKIQDHTLTSR